MSDRGEISKTRRDVFRTSVVSAVGGLVAGALAGFGVGREQGSKEPGPSRSQVAGLLGSVVAVYNQTSGPWYFFQFGPGYPLSCTAYSAPSNTTFPVIGSPPTQPTGPGPNNVVDTLSWFTSLQGQLTTLITANTAVSYNNMAGTQTQISIVTNGTGNLKPASLNSLLMALADFYQIPGSWNEIGRN